MRLPTRNFLTSVALAGAVGLVLVASVGGLSGYFSGAVICLIIAAALGFLRVDRRAPTENETQAFVASVLGKRGYTGAFTIRGFRQVTSPGIEPGNVRVKFRGEIVFREGLYQPAAPPPEVFKGLNPRKVEWILRTAAMLERELGSQAAGLVERAPADPYRATFVAERKPAGWSVPFTGSAWAAVRPEGWFWDLTNLSQSVDSLVVHGKPLGSFPAGVVLASPEGKAWLNTSLAGWRDYEAEILALQQKIDVVRAERASEAMGGFFRDVQAGTTYHGPGESLTQQVGAARYFLEVISTNAAANSISFSLRSERRWQAARMFAGTVSFDPAANRVAVHSRTSAADAQPDAGPLLSVATAFDLEMQWFPGTPARLEGASVDLALRLAEVPAGELGKVLEEVHAREREIATAIAPGAIFRGSVQLPAGPERPLRVQFLPAVDPTAGAARVESGDWSGMFRVSSGGAEFEPGYDVVLESNVVPTNTRPAVDSAGSPESPEAWSRLLLRLASGRFVGSLVCGESRHPVTLVAAIPPPEA